MKLFFKNRNNMNIAGQGGKIILFMLPALIAAILSPQYMPRLASFPESFRFIRTAGYIWLIPGVILWGAGVVQLMAGFPKGKLITKGAYAVVRNPIYSGAAFFILPAVALITMNWCYFIVSLFLYAGVMIFIRKEEQQLANAFGREYEDYKAGVDRMVPFKFFFKH